MICDCYIDEMTYGGTRGKCMATREYDPCHCEGDMSKCDFYEEVRNKVKPDENTVKGLINTLFHYPDDMKVKVVIGRKVRLLSTVTSGVDMETNETYVWLVGKDNEM